MRTSCWSPGGPTSSSACAGEIVADGGRATTYTVDLTDGDAIDALVAEVLQRHGAVDYLVNNAGRSIRRSLELSYDRFHDFERMMAVNYLGPVRLTMGLLPAMRAQRFGHVVNIVTWGNQIKAPKFAAYIAAKSALDVFGRIMGREAYFDNVTCTNVRVALVAHPDDRADRGLRRAVGRRVPSTAPSASCGPSRTARSRSTG